VAKQSGWVKLSPGKALEVVNPAAGGAGGNRREEAGTRWARALKTQDATQDPTRRMRKNLLMTCNVARLHGRSNTGSAAPSPAVFTDKFLNFQAMSCTQPNQPAILILYWHHHCYYCSVLSIDSRIIGSAKTNDWRFTHTCPVTGLSHF